VLGRTKSLVGVDIGSSAIKAVELMSAGVNHKVLAIGSEPLPADTIVDGAIVDAPAAADAIRRLFDRHRIRTKNVASAVSGSAVIVKRITLPAMSDLDLAASIAWEAEQHIPFDIDEVNLDYQPLVADAGSDPNTVEVLLAAARKEHVAQHASVISMAGRTPVIIDVAPLALQNAYETNYGVEPDALVALIDAGASATTIHVIRGDRMVFTREVAVGGNVMTGIRAAFDALPGTGSFAVLDRILVTGGASRSAGFIGALSDEFSVPVQLLDPFRRIALAAGQSSADVAGAAATSAVAVGLALRRAGDR
jgi:type IV pilus assembly protein PilM